MSFTWKEENEIKEDNGDIYIKHWLYHGDNFCALINHYLADIDLYRKRPFIAYIFDEYYKVGFFEGFKSLEEAKQYAEDHIRARNI